MYLTINRIIILSLRLILLEVRYVKRQAFGLSQFTPSMIREEDKIVEIRNKAVYARPASSPDTSYWAKEPEVLFGS
ncbi:MAG: hypothetical protein HC836_41920 [Richelia sp. RM2_1_2]|nr:hypothetical protein [Richelia sp. RM1_1_1]NJO64473.1 hypothetical protein [Richelia sp. RM2_1_2]